LHIDQEDKDSHVDDVDFSDISDTGNIQEDKQLKYWRKFLFMMKLSIVSVGV